MISDSEKKNIKALIEDVRKELFNEKESRRPLVKRFKVDYEHPLIKSGKPENIKKYQVETGIKIQIGKENVILDWNPNYKVEALNSPYLWSNDHVIRKLDFFEQKIDAFLPLGDKREIKKVIKKQTKRLLKGVDSEFGYTYLNEEIRKQKFPYLSTRLEFFWFVSEYYHLRPQLRHKEGFIAPIDSDYPFINISPERLDKYEAAFWLLRLFEKISKALDGEEHLNLKNPPFKANSPLFQKDGEKILYNALLISKVVDRYGKTIDAKSYKGVCGQLYNYFVLTKYNVLLNSTSKKDFMEYFNSHKTYDITFPNPGSSKFTDASTIEKYDDLVVETLSKIFP
jgi:hypothetical protein